MPIYEYECDICRCRFERRQKFNEEPVAMCPECEGKAHRVFHSVPIIFKGSGFYTTDNRKSKVTQPAEGEKKLPVKKEGKPE